LVLIELIDSLYSHLDNQDIIFGMYFDLQKAFDTVDDESFVQVIHLRYSLRGSYTTLSWFKSSMNVINFVAQ